MLPVDQKTIFNYQTVNYTLYEEELAIAELKLITMNVKCILLINNMPTTVGHSSELVDYVHCLTNPRMQSCISVLNIERFKTTPNLYIINYLHNNSIYNTLRRYELSLDDIINLYYQIMAANSNYKNLTIYPINDGYLEASAGIYNIYNTLKVWKV